MSYHLDVGNFAKLDTKHTARKHQKAVRLIKKVRLEAGRWQFVTIPRSGNRYLWDPRPGTCFLECWEGKQRKREAAGVAPTHVRIHSPDKPGTLKRYRSAMQNFERLLGGRRFIEAITRAEIERYKALRLGESARGKPVRAATVNFEVSVLRNWFNFLRREPGLAIENPCAHFKPLRDAASKANRPPEVYTEDELARLRRLRVALAASRLTHSAPDRIPHS